MAKVVRATEPVEPVEIENAVVRITKLGDGLVATGRHVSGAGDECYEKDETPTLPLDVALALEARGFAEIQ